MQRERGLPHAAGTGQGDKPGCIPAKKVPECFYRRIPANQPIGELGKWEEIRSALYLLGRNRCASACRQLEARARVGIQSEGLSKAAYGIAVRLALVMLEVLSPPDAQQRALCQRFLGQSR